jgi:hypothetical protein
VVASEQTQRRDVDNQRASRPQYPEHLSDGNRLVVLGQAIQDVERRHEIEKAVSERNPRDRRVGETALSVAARELEPVPRQIKSRGSAKLAEHDEVGACSAAAIQNARRLPPGERVSDERTGETPKAGPPEMALLDAIGGFEQAIHMC